MLQVIPYEQEVAGQRMQVVEDQLSKTHYLLGDEFTAVDVVCGQVLTLAEVSCRGASSLNCTVQQWPSNATLTTLMS